MNILDYIKGNRKGNKARKLEMDAMRDPFLADAMQGFDSVKGNHADNIARLQEKVMARSTSRKKWTLSIRIAVAAVAVMALLSGYFTLMNHRSTMLTAHESDSTDFNLYVPDDYLERKRMEIPNASEGAAKTTARAIVEIENLDEVISPFEPLIVYVPESQQEIQRKLQGSKIFDATTIESAANLDAHLLADVPSVPAISNTEKPRGEINEQVLSVFEKKESTDTTNAGGNMVAEKLAKKKIAGKVLDERGEPLIGATVTLKGTSIAAMTDVDGNYVIETDQKTPELVAQYIGFETKNISAASSKQNITMKDSHLALEEVVVVGYGTQKKSSVTGAVSKVDTKDLSAFYTKPTSAADALSGKLAGASIVTESSSKSRISIRPVPAIGEKEYNKYLATNVRKVNSDSCETKKGKVKLQFIIDSQGSPTNIIVISGLCSGFDAEAIRLVKEGPKWTGSGTATIEVKF